MELLNTGKDQIFAGAVYPKSPVNRTHRAEAGWCLHLTQTSAHVLPSKSFGLSIKLLASPSETRAEPGIAGASLYCLLAVFQDHVLYFLCISSVCLNNLIEEMLKKTSLTETKEFACSW